MRRASITFTVAMLVACGPSAPPDFSPVVWNRSRPTAHVEAKPTKTFPTPWDETVLHEVDARAAAEAAASRANPPAAIARGDVQPPPPSAPPVASARPTATTTPVVAAGGLTAAAPQPGAYALIFGIDHYRDVPAAPGARADAEHFAQLAKQTLGLRDEHVRVGVDDHATRSDIVGGLKWLKDNVSAGGRVYFFFSGHGAPTVDSSTFIVPYDGNAKDIAGSAVSMNEIMAALAETKAKEILAMVDACFSGAGGRSVLPPGARPLVRVKEAVPSAQVAVFTASQGDEISGPAPGENAGAFTKYLVMGLGSGQADANGDGQITLQELSDWVTPRVARDAKKDNRDQHPNLLVGKGLGAQNFVVEYGLVTK